MKTLFHILLIAFISCLSVQTYGRDSLIEGTIDGLDIPNTHYVIDHLYIRGQAPRNLSDIHKLKDLNVKNVLIFKNQTKNEVDIEKKWLQDEKITFLHLDFPWKNIVDEVKVCKMAVQGILFLKSHGQKGSVNYFHCTVGEDRTGLLAGLLTLTSKPRLSVKSIFRDEMCQRGFADGNPGKDSHVAQLVKDNLTPLFLKMAYIITKQNGKISETDCEKNFNNDPHFQSSIYSKTHLFQCAN